MVDSAVARYIVATGLSYQHASSTGFVKFMQTVSPAVKLSKSDTIQRRVLAMYIVLKVFIMEYLTTLSVAVSLTFDGWSNTSLRGFYVCTAHWADTRVQVPDVAPPQCSDLDSSAGSVKSNPRLHDVVLDFFHVPPGPGVGTRCGTYLSELVQSYHCTDKLVAVVTDGGGDAVLSAKLVVSAVAKSTSTTKTTCTHITCFAHTFQLAIKPVTELVQLATEKLRSCLSYLRGSKVRRGMFRTFAKVNMGRSMEVPALDTPTRWNSTHVMVDQSLKLRETISATMLGTGGTSDMILTEPEWSTVAKVNTFLEKPARLSTRLGSSAVPSISLAYNANKAMVEHCNKYVYDTDVMLAQSAQSMLASLLVHQSQLNCAPTSIARYLDVRLARDPSLADFRSDELVVLTLLDTPRYAAKTTATATLVASMLEADDSDDDDGLFGRRPEVLCVTQDAELKRFSVIQQVAKDVDIIGWWVDHRLEFPTLYTVAMDYLAIPASSVASERANSMAKRVFHGRESLGNDMFKIEMCCKSWLEFAGAIGHELPTDFLDAYNVLRKSMDIEALGQADSAILYALDNLK
jgi:hypothetical protein